MEFLFLATIFVLETSFILAEIRSGVVLNKLAKVKPVGGHVAKNFIPLTEIPPPKQPQVHYHNGRRHFDPNCMTAPPQEVVNGPQVDIFGEYYEDQFAKTVATVIFPDHIDHHHFEVTTQVPYFTVGTIEAIGYHPSTIKGDHPDECEKIYQDHVADQYQSDESGEPSEESLEMARMPLAVAAGTLAPIDPDKEANMYDDDK